VKDDPDRFMEWLSNKADLSFKNWKNWEAGYEVCFYRDYYKWLRKGISIKKSKYSEKRSFDLCFFSEEAIVIIEAKVHEIFESDQVDSFEKDRTDIKKLLYPNAPEILIIALAGERYFAETKKFDEWKMKGIFDEKITWKDLADYANDLENEETAKIFRRANKLRYAADLTDLAE